MTSETKISPMMLQWHECKKIAKEALLFFRLGDFYEAFHEDAVICAKELELTLTKRQTIPMSGIPSHTLDGYIDKLVAKGYKVAIAEQVPDNLQPKGLMKREVTRVVTAGTLLNSSLLLEKSHNFIASLTEIGTQIGIAFFDMTCSDCRVIEVTTLEDAFSELYRFQPKELIISERIQIKYASFFKEVKASLNCSIEPIENWRFDHELALGFLVRTLQVRTLDGFGLKGYVAAINAAGALLAHVKETLHAPLGPIQSILPYSKDTFMSIDKTTMRNLDLVASSNKNYTLLHILDQTKTPMGGRLLRQWVLEPLLQLDLINERHDAIEELLQTSFSFPTLQETLSFIRDLERLMIKISTGNATPRDFISLKNSLIPLHAVKESLSMKESAFLTQQAQRINSCIEPIDLISRALIEEPPLRLSDGGIFKEGYHAILDELNHLAKMSQDWMIKYQTQIREETGIKTLKVGYTRVSGFYIEVSRGQAEKIPSHFHRRQTLTNAERYMTAELKAYEEKILTAEEKIGEIELELFKELKEKISAYLEEILITAKAIAQIDCIVSLASVAKQNRYTRPQMSTGSTLNIVDGRHPVIETANLHEKFIPNDTSLDGDQNRLMLITGPNMAGKSTYIRQVALITIMAQMGSFVPAKLAEIGLIDKVFTRIGASDDLSRGQSTFMVEMIETAYILHHTTAKSLVILDEIGRGTSTYDGISLAWSIAEYLLTTPQKTAKTLFATHYWELTKLEEKVPGAKNFNVAVHEAQDQIVFLRKIVRGGTDKSYGIHVAKLAGLPHDLLERAKEILEHLEENSNQKKVFEAPRSKRIPPSKLMIKPSEIQLSLLKDI